MCIRVADAIVIDLNTLTECSGVSLKLTQLFCTSVALRKTSTKQLTFNLRD